ncbi:glycosyltransferase [Phytohabitans rumicis]|uniref:glycosyltransferase n=1 Tax=Phytohabitans rumicis TaxID=1076125 RepID=UPI001FE2E6E3|nr:glycosyltransferase [Phytohabitans rumicis]
MKIVELPLARADLETDIRLFDRDRALDPAKWLRKLRKHEQDVFPEPAFGAWKGALEKAVLEVHRQRPADLLVATCVPYVTLAAAWKLWQEHKVPYAVDFRDGWSVDVVHGGEAFAADSESGVWERRVLEDAISLWVVNDPIAGFYRNRYPHLADRIHVVRNGYDKDSVSSEPRRADPDAGLTFGYIGTVNFPAQQLETVLDAWRAARESDPLIAKSRFEVYGHIGAGPGREANRLMELIRGAAGDGVSFGGPLKKAEVAKAYAHWDALVLILVGGQYVTSGKVYEYMATGLPIVSVHEIDHDATHVLTGHPLWTGARGLDEAQLADAFQSAGRMAVQASDEERAAVRAHAAPFTREDLMTKAVHRLAEQALASRLISVNGPAA